MSLAGVKAPSPIVTDLLKGVRRYVDPHRYLQLVKNAKDPAQAVNLFTCDVAEISKCITLLKGLQDNLDEASFAQKVDIAWLTTAFYSYMRLQRWTFPREHGEKNSLVKSARNDLFAIINTVVLEVNSTWEQQKWNLGKDGISTNQKLLMIHHALPYLYQSHQNDLLEDQLSVLPLGLSSSVVFSVQKWLHKPGTTSIGCHGQGDTEAWVNDHIANGLSALNLAQMHRPLKNPEKKYFDYVTGLELDFPLASNLTLETDGPHHYFDESKRHDPVHSLKAIILRETGWIRLPVDVFKKDANKVKAYLNDVAHILSVPVVNEDIDCYNQVLKQHQNLLYQIRRGEWFYRAEQNPLKRDRIRTALETLLTKEHEYRKVIEGRHIEKTHLDYNSVRNSDYQSVLRKLKAPSIILKEISECKTTLDGLQQSMAQNQAQLRQLDARIDEQKELIQAQIQGSKDHINELQSSIVHWQAEIETEKCRFEKYNRVFSKMNSCDQGYAEKQRFLQELNRSIKNKKDKIDALEGELRDEMSNKADAERKLIYEIRDMLDFQSPKRLPLEQSLGQLQDSIAQRQQKIDALNQEYTESSKYINSDELRTFFSSRRLLLKDGLITGQIWHNEFQALNEAIMSPVVTDPLEGGVDVRENDTQRSSSYLPSYDRTKKRGNEDPAGQLLPQGASQRRRY